MYFIRVFCKSSLLKEQQYFNTNTLQVLSSRRRQNVSRSYKMLLFRISVLALKMLFHPLQIHENSLRSGAGTTCGA